MVALGWLPSAGVRFKPFSLVDHDIRRAPFVRGISLVDRIHVQELDQHVRGVTGHFLDDAASHNDGDTWLHVLSSLIFGAYIGNLLDSEHIPEGALPNFVKLGKGRPVTLGQIIGVLWNVP